MSESRILGVQIFQEGRFRGKLYSGRDLEDMCQNFNTNSSGRKPRLRVPLVIGHSEDQRLLEDTGIPAAGYIERIYRKGKKLFADFSDVAPAVARLINGRRYRRVSAEVYDEAPQGTVGQGKTLRRVALLGGDLPQIKTLADIPLPEAHSEQHSFDPVGQDVVLSTYAVVPTAEGTWQVFSEVTPMGRKELLEKLAAHGVDTSKFPGSVPEEFLAEVCRALEEGGSGEEDHAEGDEPEVNKSNGGRTPLTGREVRRLGKAGDPRLEREVKSVEEEELGPNRNPPKKNAEQDEDDWDAPSAEERAAEERLQKSRQRNSPHGSGKDLRQKNPTADGMNRRQEERGYAEDEKRSHKGPEHNQPSSAKPDFDQQPEETVTPEDDEWLGRWRKDMRQKFPDFAEEDGHMDRAALLEELGHHGIDPEKITDAVPDEVLVEILQALGGGQEPEQHEPEEPGEPEEQEPEEEHGKGGHEHGKNVMVAGPAKDPGSKEGALRMCEMAHKHMEHARRYADKYGCSPEEMSKFERKQEHSERTGKSLEKLATGGTMKMSEIEAAVERVLNRSFAGRVGELQKFAEETTAAQKRTAVDAWLDAQVKAGKVTPRELDPRDPANLRDRLLRADSRSVIASFTESAGGRKVKRNMTELDLQIREVEGRRPFLFGEKVRSGQPGGGAADSESETEVQKVEDHWDSYSEQFTKMSTPKEELVGAYKTRRKQDPTLTAERFLDNRN